MMILKEGKNWTFLKCLAIGRACRSKAQDLVDEQVEAEKAGRPARVINDLEKREKRMIELYHFWRWKADRVKNKEKRPECGNTPGAIGDQTEQADYIPAA